MQYRELYNAIDGLSAYDHGSVDSGIHDEALRARVIDYIQGLETQERRALLAKIVIESTLDAASLEAGYGPEDAKELLEWFDEYNMLV